MLGNLGLVPHAHPKSMKSKEHKSPLTNLGMQATAAMPQATYSMYIMRALLPRNAAAQSIGSSPIKPSYSA